MEIVDHIHFGHFNWSFARSPNLNLLCLFHGMKHFLLKAILLQWSIDGRLLKLKKKIDSQRCKEACGYWIARSVLEFKIFDLDLLRSFEPKQWLKSLSADKYISQILMHGYWCKWNSHSCEFRRHESSGTLVTTEIFLGLQTHSHSFQLDHKCDRELLESAVRNMETLNQKLREAENVVFYNAMEIWIGRRTKKAIQDLILYCLVISQVTDSSVLLLKRQPNANIVKKSLTLRKRWICCSSGGKWYDVTFRLACSV